MAEVGKMKTADLVKFLGSEISIHQADVSVNKKGKPKKYPLYLRHPAVRVIQFHTDAGQKFLAALLGVKAEAVKAVAEKQAAPVAEKPVEKPAAPVVQKPAEKKSDWLDDL